MEGLQSTGLLCLFLNRKIKMYIVTSVFLDVAWRKTVAVLHKFRLLPNYRSFASAPIPRTPSRGWYTLTKVTEVPIM